MSIVHLRCNGNLLANAPQFKATNRKYTCLRQLWSSCELKNLKLSVHSLKYYSWLEVVHMTDTRDSGFRTCARVPFTTERAGILPVTRLPVPMMVSNVVHLSWNGPGSQTEEHIILKDGIGADATLSCYAAVFSDC